MVDTSLFAILAQIAGIVVGSLVIGEILLLLAARHPAVAPNEVRDIRYAVNIVWIAFVVFGILKVLGVTSEFSTSTVSGAAGLAATPALQSSLPSEHNRGLLHASRLHTATYLTTRSNMPGSPGRSLGWGSGA